MVVNNKKTATCLVCNQIAEFFVRKNNYDVYHCRNCETMFVWPKVQDSGKIYQKKYFCGSEKSFGYSDYDGDKKIIVENFVEYLKKINKFSPIKGRMLDVGAATGNFVELAASNGWFAEGIEVSENAAYRANRHNLNVMCGDFETHYFDTEIFDMVTLLDVFEHLANPEAAMVKVQKILKNNGLVVINTPDSSSFLAKFFGRSWHSIVPPEHLTFFSPKSIEILLRRNNFEVVFIGRIGKKFSLRYIFKTLANWHNFFIWTKISNYLFKHKIGKLKISLNTRDNMFVIAKKSAK